MKAHVVQFCMMGVLVTLLSSLVEASPSDDIQKLKAAHTDRSAYEVRFRSPLPPLDASTESMLKSRPGWWNVVEWFDDPVTSSRMPIGMTGRMVVGEDLAVRTERRLLMGPPELQLGTIELVGREFYVQQHSMDSVEANFTHYPALTPSELKRARSLGRLANVDVWGPSTYSTLVAHVIEQFETATDCITTMDGPTAVVSSSQVGITAWIDPDGSLRSARLALSGGEVLRFDYHGIAAQSFFPARFPAELRVVEESNTNGGGANPRVMQIVLFDAPKRLGSESLALVDPKRLAANLIDLTPKDANRGIGTVAYLQGIPTSSILWGVSASGLCVFTVLAVHRVLKHRKAA